MPRDHDPLCPASDVGTRCYCVLIRQVIKREHDDIIRVAAGMLNKAMDSLRDKAESLPRSWVLDEDRGEPMFVYGVLLRDVRTMLGGDTS